MNQYSKIIIDGTNLFYRNYFIKKEKNININDNIIESGAIEGFLKSIQKIEKNHGSELTDYYFLWDNMSSKDLSRKELDFDYKINREKYTKEFYKSIDILTLIILNKSNKYNSVRVEKYEADDLPPALINSFSKYDKVLVCSEDLDYSRVISENVDWMQHDIIYDKMIFKNKFGFSPTKEKIIMWKALTGDTSDNIPKALHGFHNKDILYLVEKYNTVYEMLENIYLEKDIIGEKSIALIKENQSRLILNSQLIDFIDIDYDYLQQFVFKGSFNPTTLRTLYTMLNFNISEIDHSLTKSFIPEKETNDLDFFQYETIKRL